jgi:type IV pilus assembly protein PilA
MSEPLAALAEAKTTLSEYYATNTAFPANATAGGVNTNPDKLIVTSLAYSSTNSSQGALVTALIRGGIIPGNAASNTLGFSLSSITKSDGSIQWTCRRTLHAADASLSNNIEAKYLPSNCRE